MPDLFIVFDYDLLPTPEEWAAAVRRIEPGAWLDAEQMPERFEGRVPGRFDAAPVALSIALSELDDALRDTLQGAVPELASAILVIDAVASAPARRLAAAAAAAFAVCAEGGLGEGDSLQLLPAARATDWYRRRV